MRKLPHRERVRLFKINKTMSLLHNINNDIYENWVDEDWETMEIKIKNQINTLKQLLNGIQEET
tara:strand:- start:4785 stop:4976 length:192 start_codon:yes stop_codon:yes gene_type:complete